MKRITYIFLSLSLILFSCHKSPESMFSVDDSSPEVGQTVFFNNNSHYGDHYEWDFGDGYISNDRNPSHIFTATGSYEVILTVTSGSSTDESSLIINVLVPTLLVIEVREWTPSLDGDLVPDASVLLYPTSTDWDNQTHSVNEGFTDVDGIAVFSNLDPYVYYVDVWEATHDNYQLASEDIGFIRTPEVVPNRITFFTAFVDFVNHPSGIKGDKKFVVKKLMKRSYDNNNANPYPGEANWQELYKRSIKK
jgi:PKD repeat protein